MSESIPANSCEQKRSLLTMSRRCMFQRAGMGVGGLALSSMLARDLSAASKRVNPMVAKTSHFAAKAKNVIYIHLVGAPSHLDLFDYKPQLQERSGQKCPDEFFKGKQLAFIRQHPTLLGTPKDSKFQFKACGKSGIHMSNLLPNLQTVADEMCM